MAGLRLSLDQFLLSLKLAPRMVVEVILENKEGGLLMLKREGEPFEGSWHLPGSFLMKGESIDECIKRILKDECGEEGNQVVVQFVGVFENLDSDPRGHLIHYVVKVRDVGTRVIGYQKRFLSELGYK